MVRRLANDPLVLVSFIPGTYIPNMPKNNNWVKWRNHPAREIILEDLNYGGWLHDEFMDGDLNLASVFAIYNHQHPEVFNEIDFSQFKARMQDYATKNLQRRERSNLECEWMMTDQKLHPRQSTNARGELVFDLHPAKKLLREDIIAGAHVGMVPTKFQATRVEYQKFDGDIFRQRIYQEERYQKYLNWLEDKRTAKRRAYKEAKLKKAHKQEKQERKEAKKKAKEAEKKLKAEEKKRKKEVEKQHKEATKQARPAKKRRVLTRKIE
jgi:hypothetical protein